MEILLLICVIIIICLSAYIWDSQKRENKVIEILLDIYKENLTPVSKETYRKNIISLAWAISNCARADKYLVEKSQENRTNK